MWIYVLLVVAVVLALWWWGTSTYGSLSGIPGPDPKPFIGNIIEIMKTGQYESQALLMRQYGGVVRFFVGSRGLVLVSDPDIVHEVTVTASEKFINRPQQTQRRQKQSLGLLQARDDYWKRLRRTIAPTFNAIHMKSMITPMHEEIQVLMSQLEEACDAKREVDIHGMFTRLTLDIIGRVAFGSKLHTQTTGDHELIEASGWIFRNVPRNQGMFAMVFPNLFEFKERVMPSAKRREVTKAQNTLDEVSLKLIRKRKAERDSEVASTATLGEDGQRVPNDFLDLLLDARDKHTGQMLTEEEIRDQANTFLLAGHETTANTLAYTIFLLAQHPDVDERLYKELAAALNVDDLPTLNQLSAFTDLTIALKESLRMYPPATTIAREANQDVVIGGKYHIPKGTSTIVPVKAINNNPALWEEPDKFRPFERFASDEKGEGEKKHALIWLPFGAGPRNCIGQRFALIEAKLVLATVLRRFRFQLSPGQLPLQLQPGITTSPKYGIKVTLQRR